MMGARWSEFGVDNPRVEVTAGSYTQGAEPPSGKDSEGSPTVTCRLDFTNDAGGAPDKTIGLGTRQGALHEIYGGWPCLTRPSSVHFGQERCGDGQAS